MTSVSDPYFSNFNFISIVFTYVLTFYNIIIIKLDDYDYDYISNVLCLCSCLWRLGATAGTSQKALIIAGVTVKGVIGMN